MKNVIAIFSLIGVLIAIYLFLSRSNETSKIIQTLAENTTKGISVLQGR